MTQPIIIAPSILSADFAMLGTDCAAVINAGADWIHVDVMDGHYVPNITIGPVVVKSLRKHLPHAFLDTHLMIEPVDTMIASFVEAGSSLISFHPEASKHVDRTLRMIRDAGVKVGLVLNPATPTSILEHTLPLLDMVLLMSVNPGFGGQSFLPHVLAKASDIKARVQAMGKTIGKDFHLQIDGGITAATIKSAADAGVNAFVAGTAVFGHKDKNYTEAINLLRQSAQ